MSADARTRHDQARGRTGSGQTPTAEPFVGRAHELGVVASLLAAAADGRGSLTVVSGEAGIGKSRFCDEVADRADRAGLAVVTARCWVDGGAPALWPWQPILRRLCGDAAADLLDADRGDRAVDPERFARFIAVTDRLAAACERAPVCLVIDDVHAADAGTLLLIRFVARTLTGAPLAVIVSRRRGEPVDGARAALLDDIEREATPVVLDRFDLDETGAFLATHGWPEIGPDLRTALHRVTGGNPLFLRRIAALGVVGSDAALPGGVEVAIRDAVARLDAGPRRVLQAAAVLGARPAVSEAAGVAEVEPAAVLDAVAHAEDAGLVSVRGPDRFAYGHELVRAAFEQGLAAGDRLDAHARAVRLVAPDSTALAPERSARRAHHALAAAARSAGDARLAVTACRAASRSMAASFAYEQADRLVSAAVEVHERPGLGAPPAQLLVEWAEAALLCGQLAEARGRFERAATAAQREGDAVLLGRAAVGLGGHWVNERRTPVEKARVLGLQRSALAGLPDVHEGLRCRLRARLAAEATYDGAPPEPVGAAVAAARTSGDPLALAESLSLWHHTLLAPEFARRRPGIADELVGVASEHGHGFLALMGLCWRAVDLFLLGDPRAAQALEVLRERADALVSLNIKYIVDVLDVMLLVRAGRLAEAEAAAQRCYDLGTEVGEVDALAYLSAHTLAIRWIQGRDAELLDLAADIAASPTLVQAEFAFRATAAAIAARAGHHDRARAAIEGLAPEGLAGLPRSSTWLVGMVAIVEVAAEVGDRVVADEVYALLAPFADLPVMPSLAVACLGSTERALGLAAQTAGRLERAVGHFERAVDANRRLGNRPLVAIATAELAAALDRRGRDGDRERAAGLLDEAVGEADAMRLTGRAAAWRARRAALTGPTGGDGPGGRRPGRPPSARAARRGVIRREGRGWLVEVDEHRVFVRDLVGMGYLAQLVVQPGRLVSALSLASHGAVAGARSRQDVLDDEARAAYAARSRDLVEDLAEAEANNDLARAERLRAEIDALVEALDAATGLGGRSRTFTHDGERARTAVRKALRRAIDEIDAADGAIGQLLRSSVTTGATCVYAPVPGLTWSTAGDGGGDLDVAFDP